MYHSFIAMKGKSPDQSALNLFEPVLRQIVKRNHPLTVFSDNFPWNEIESEYSHLYSDKGAPAKPVRLMTGLLILKHIFNCSDEGVVAEWSKDPYFQYLCGGNLFIDKQPCDPSDLARFRKRIGKERLQGLMDLSEKFQQRAGVDRIRTTGETRPGRENFSYSAGAGLYHSFLRNIRNLAGRLTSR